MTTSPPSSSEAQDSRSFDLLDPRIQRWIWSSGWTELRDAQEKAIPLILAGDRDVIIAASTASGKTEAAFLPILTRLLQEQEPMGCALYISPLKALINDQWGRLEALTESLGVPVTPWHGDISQTKKGKFLKAPEGCLLITPESLEAILARRRHGLKGLLANVRYLVVDELHAFMGTERGKQLQSLMHRVESALGRGVCRVGLSATLGDMRGAAEFLRPGGGDQVELVVSKDGGQELMIQVKGVLDAPQDPRSSSHPKSGPSEEEGASPALDAIARHLYKVLRGSNNLVFPNNRQAVEAYSDRLRRLCEVEAVPNEFWPHHGSLAKDIREETEAALKQKERPATAICTTTLELGIDIGSVKSVVQIGPPPSVASLRQRLGRSGRRKGEPAILRAYCVERPLSSHSPISDQLREGLVQTIAMIQLLLEGWYEPTRADGLHASTLIQQLLSAIAQHGGAKAGALWTLLCEQGPFRAVPQAHFIDLLRALGQQEILMQDPTGLLLLAPKGERIVEHYTFYAAFTSVEEFRIVTAGKSLGSMPVSRPLQEGSYLIFAGRRWEVVSVSMEDLTIEVIPAAGGTLPAFEGGQHAKVHDRVRATMRKILESSAAVPFLDATGQQLLREARENYRRLGLAEKVILQSGKETHLLTWLGDWVNDTLELVLRHQGLKASREGLGISVQDTTVDELTTVLRRLSSGLPISADELAAGVENKVQEKWDFLLPEALLSMNFASMQFDVPGVTAFLTNAHDV